jgi:hypothetical protein
MNERIQDMVMSTEHREKPADFTRQRKIGFAGILVSVLINRKRTLAVEVDDFIKKMNVEPINEYTKQAYSKARQKLKPSAFISLNDVILEETYKDTYKTFKNYRLIGVDGSTGELPNTAELKSVYGVFSEENCSYPAARVCLLYDVLNEVILNGKLFSYNESEQAAALELIPTVSGVGSQDLFLFDRGFPSVRLITLLNSLGKKFVMRVSKSFLKEVNDFTESTDIDKTIFVNITKRRIATNGIKDVHEPVSFNHRCVRIKLETEDEILITNLTPEEMSLDELKWLYGKRWGIETNYDLMKNALEFENFTGDTDRAIQQDFYATIYIINLASVMIIDAQEEYEKNHEDKQTKYEYKINKRMAISYLKNDLLHVLLQDSPTKASKLYEKFVKKLSKHVVPIRNARNFARPLGHKPKYGRTNKRVI